VAQLAPVASGSPFPFGDPPHEDVERAANLLVRYNREAPLSPDELDRFCQLLANPRAVLNRARQLADAVEP
jgi:hypothetical protein